MKILFVSGGVPSPIGQIHLFNLLRSVGKSHDVRVICFRDPNNPSTTQSQDLRSGEDLIAVPLIHRHVIRRALGSVLRRTPIAVETYRSRCLADAISLMCQKEQFDVVVIEQLALGQYFPIVRHIPNLLFPVDAVSRLKAQRCRAAINPFMRIALALDCQMIRRYERYIYHRFDGVIFVSSEDARYAVDIDQIEASRVHVLPNGVDIAYFRPDHFCAENNLSLVFLGNMKNDINEHAVLWFLTHVWPTLQRLIPDLQFFIVGSGPSDRLRQCARRDSHIVLTGYQDDIRPYIWKATVFISPLQMGTGIKNRVLQAMAMGKAIVASPLSVDGMGVKDGQHLMVASDANMFIQKIYFLLGHVQKRTRLSREARQFVECHHSLEGAASKFLDIVTQILRQKTNFTMV